MFFSAELLAKRDSGFGLLWLAATLGNKSAFKKLPKRSILTANLPELCDSISDPDEPLALRLSSNLMVGAATVYKAKHELFLSDVTTCYTQLKRAMTELHNAGGAIDSSLLMQHTSARSDVVNLSVDPMVALALDLDTFGLDWDNVNILTRQDADEDAEFDPSQAMLGSKQEGKKRAKENADALAMPPPSFVPRSSQMHTLNEDHLHEQFLNHSGGELNAMSGGPSSSSNPFIGGDMDLDFGDVDLGPMLGPDLEGWHISETPTVPRTNAGNAAEINPSNDFGGDMDMGFDDFAMQECAPGSEGPLISGITLLGDSDKENRPPGGSEAFPSSPLAMTRPQADGNVADVQPATKTRERKRTRARLVFDRQTELSDDELKSNRRNYLEMQNALRAEQDAKNTVKDWERLVDDMIAGVPRGAAAPLPLDSFLLENYEARVKAHASAGRQEEARVETEAAPKKRRRTAGKFTTPPPAGAGDGAPAAPEFDFGGWDDLGGGFGDDFPMADQQLERRSSEEPEQARRAASRPPSLPGSAFSERRYQVFDEQLDGSRRSSVLPWDNAGNDPSSSNNNDIFGSADIRLSLPGSLRGSPQSSTGGRPAADASRTSSVVRRNSFLDDDFQFGGLNEEGAAVETQQSAAAAAALERNSHNFLEYAKQKRSALPANASTLMFTDIVPKEESTPHVAASGFYHCLVLATKDLLRLTQEIPYGPIKIVIK